MLVVMLTLPFRLLFPLHHAAPFPQPNLSFIPSIKFILDKTYASDKPSGTVLHEPGRGFPSIISQQEKHRGPQWQFVVISCHKFGLMIRSHAACHTMRLLILLPMPRAVSES